MLSRSLGWATTMPNAHALLRAVLFINVGLAGLQHAADLPAGRRPDSSVSALVCDGARPQLDGGHAARLRRRGRANRTGLADWIRLVWCSLCVHPDELLGRTKAIEWYCCAWPKLPRRDGFACPWCKAAPPPGNFWKCGAVLGRCSTSSKRKPSVLIARSSSPAVQCLECGRTHPMSDWAVPTFVTAKL